MMLLLKQRTFQGNLKSHFLFSPRLTGFLFFKIFVGKTFLWVGGWGIGSGVRALLHKHESLNSNLQHPCNKLEMASVHTSVLGEAETEDNWYSLVIILT